MKAIVLAGGDLTPAAHIPALLEGAELVLAADSGLRHARALGLEPQAVVGDFDSVSPEDLAAYPQLTRITYPARKDELDLELAIARALDLGASELVILGAFGGRLDQTLACMLICSRLHRQGVRVSMHDGERDAYPLTAGRSLAPDLPPGTVFSLLALEEATCTVRGAEYPLSSATLPVGVGLGVANRASGEVNVEVHAGLVVVIVEWTVA